MEKPESSVPTSPEPDLVSLQAQYASLRLTVVALLVLVIFLSFAFFLYLLRQVNYARKDLDAVRQQVAPIITDYQTNTGPMMDTFVQKLTEYGRTHADFQPIMKKYGMDKPAPGATGAAPATGTLPAAAPTAAPAPKK